MRLTTFDVREPWVTRRPVPSDGGDSTGPMLIDAPGLGDAADGDASPSSIFTPGVIDSFQPTSIRFGSYLGLSGSSDGYFARFQ